MVANPQRLQFLDGLRGIAALSVVLFHHYLFLNFVTSMTFPYLLEAAVLKGYLGVQIFFVLSGFVIAYSIRHASISWTYIQQFFIKRSIRLDPPYWAALFLMVIASILFSKVIAKQQDWIFTSDQILTNAFYLQEFLGFDSINPVAWTLCIELQLYLFFVCILHFLFWIQRAKTVQDQMNLIQSTAFGVFFALLLIWSLSYHNSAIAIHVEDWTPKGLFFSYWYSFFIGAATCWTTMGRMSKNWLWLYFGLVGFCLTLNFDEQVLTCLAVAMVIYAMGKWGYLETFTCSEVFQYLGRISFSLYLIHWLIGSNCIYFLFKRVGELNMLKFSFIYLFSIGISIIAAHLFYQWIEAPCLKWSKNFGKEQIVNSR